MGSGRSLVSRRQFLGATLSATLATPLTAARVLAREEVSLEGRDLMRDKTPVLHPDGLPFGCYDPHGDFSDDDRVATEHLFLPWEDVDLQSLPTADAYASARDRNVMITVEPWSWARDEKITSVELYLLILAGERDAHMRAICDAVAGFKSPVIIRWAQEMDNPFNRFTWSDWEPHEYIAAFRRMARIVRETLPDARMMWSPTGEKTLQAFYPGDEHVDLIGLTVLGLEEYDIVQHGRALTFAESVQQGYELSAVFHKPIWVAELAYEGRLEYLANWVMDVTRDYPQYPALKQVVYFNDKEVWEWPHDLGLPNWRVLRDDSS